MRIRALGLLALVSLPAVVGAQVTIRPRGGLTPTQPAEKPTEIPAVARALALHRARWSAEGYSIVSAIQLPTGVDAVTNYTTFGAGTRADYRFSDRFSATVDMTASPFGSLQSSQTAEVGARLLPLPSSQIRPYLDLRGAFMNMSDRYALPVGTSSGFATPNQQYTQRFSRGFGAVAGAGAEMFVSNNFAITATVTGMRNRMTVYEISNASSLPVGSTYWLTAMRFALGFKYNPANTLNFAQNPRM